MKKYLETLLPLKYYDFLRDIKHKVLPKVNNAYMYTEATNNLSGIEIGGPTYKFKYQVPIYSNCFNLDFVNFSRETVWEGKLSDRVNYIGKKYGRQYVAEATDLSIFSSRQFDFLLSCNCLEHVANPIKALSESKRITSGKIILILPRKDYNFDHKRSITSFEHLLEDYKNDIDESDLTHLDEILSLHDIGLDIYAGSFEQFHKRSLDNFNNRCLHHHVFDDKLIKQICDYLEMSIIEQSANKKDWFFILDTNH